jgi:uncharacterized protein
MEGMREGLGGIGQRACAGRPARTTLALTKLSGTIALALTALLTLAPLSVQAQDAPAPQAAEEPATTAPAGEPNAEPAAETDAATAAELEDRASALRDRLNAVDRTPAPAPAPDSAAEPSLPGNEAPAPSVSIFLPPTSMPMPVPLDDPTPDTAFGAFQRGFYLTALELALPLAEEGNPAAQTLVAEIFAGGFGIARDLGEAAFWYGQAAAQDYPPAQFEYALFLLEGRHVAADPQQARALMRAAADSGHAASQFNYAQSLVRDFPGERGLIEAMPYFEQSAEQGIADAQYALSQIYLNATGIEDAKRQRAREWLFRAARAGYDTAQLDTAIWLIDGIGGPRDYETGFGWMQRAARAGNVIAQNRMAHLLINAIGTRPDPVQAGMWYVLSRRAGLNDPALADFFLGLTDEDQRRAIEAANRFPAV